MCNLPLIGAGIMNTNYLHFSACINSIKRDENLQVTQEEKRDKPTQLQREGNVRFNTESCEALFAPPVEQEERRTHTLLSISRRSRRAWATPASLVETSFHPSPIVCRLISLSKLVHRTSIVVQHWHKGSIRQVQPKLHWPHHAILRNVCRAL